MEEAAGGERADKALVDEEDGRRGFGVELSVGEEGGGGRGEGAGLEVEDVEGMREVEEW